MMNIREIADNADMIINGYAFTKSDENIRVLNLNNTKSAAVLNSKGRVIETTMCEIELDILMDIYSRNKVYMED